MWLLRFWFPLISYSFKFRIWESGVTSLEPEKKLMAQHAAGKWATWNSSHRWRKLPINEDGSQADNRNPFLLFFIQYPLVALRSGAHRISAITARPGTKLAMIDLIRLWLKNHSPNRQISHNKNDRTSNRGKEIRIRQIRIFLLSSNESTPVLTLHMHPCTFTNRTNVLRNCMDWNVLLTTHFSQ